MNAPRMGSVRTGVRIAVYEARDVARGRWIIVYALLLLGLAQALVMFEADVVRAAAGLVNAALLVTPLVGLLFGALYMYGARDFNRLLLAHPVGRRQLFGGLYLGVALPLVGAELLGLGLPLGIAALRQGAGFGSVGRLLVVVVALTLVSVALAFFLAVTIRDRAAGMGLAILVWLGLTVLYDGLFASLAVAFPDTILEKPALLLTLLNPVDTARILLLMEFDAAALLGYTGAVFRGFFGGTTGVVVSSGVLAAWIALPLVAARRAFDRADL